MLNFVLDLLHIKLQAFLTSHTYSDVIINGCYHILRLLKFISVIKCKIWVGFDEYGKIIALNRAITIYIT